MPPFGPIKRQKLISYLSMGGKHQYMVKGKLKLAIPNPHQGDIGRDLLARILQQAEIDKAEWQQL